MRITPKDTIAGIIEQNSALFGMGAARITEQLKELPNCDRVFIKRKFWFDRQIATRSAAGITMGELDAIEKRAPSYEYFQNVLAVRLGLVKFKKNLSNGQPDWNSGYKIYSDKIGKMRFIRAYKYFMEVQKELDGIAKAWKKLEMPDDNLKRSKIKRPNRGMTAICRKYCQLMDGAVRPEEVWNIPWATVYEAFESCKYDNMEQRAAYEASKPKTPHK